MKFLFGPKLTAGIILFSILLLENSYGQITVSPAELRAIAKEAYVYGFPMVDGYRIQDAYFFNKKSPEFKAPINHLANFPRVFTAADTVVQTPNSDTPYGFLELDLRGAPMRCRWRNNILCTI